MTVLTFIANDEKQNGLGQRIFAIIAESVKEGYQDESANWDSPRIIVFRNILSGNGVRYTTPTIDLNIAYSLCREVGKRILSQEYDWQKEALKHGYVDIKHFVRFTPV